MFTLFKKIAPFALAALLASPVATLPTLASPVLRADVVVDTAIVTVADMFDNAGVYAELPLFRAPEPGTSGRVNLEAVQQAATRAGIGSFENPGVLAVKVARTGTLIDEIMLRSLVTNDLSRRGIITDDMSADIVLDRALPLLYSSNQTNTVRLLNLRYLPVSGQFNARFMVAGSDAPLDLSGRLDFSILVPHLITSQRSGAILNASDIEMRPVLVRYTDRNDVATYEQVLGMQLRRSSRSGLMLRPVDVLEPQVVKRNQEVTLFYRSGPLTLTVKGRALVDGAKGDIVSVLNLMSNKVVTGIAIDAGAVELSSGLATTASL